MTVETEIRFRREFGNFSLAIDLEKRLGRTESCVIVPFDQLSRAGEFIKREGVNGFYGRERFLYMVFMDGDKLEAYGLKAQNMNYDSRFVVGLMWAFSEDDLRNNVIQSRNTLLQSCSPSKLVACSSFGFGKIFSHQGEFTCLDNLQAQGMNALMESARFYSFGELVSSKLAEKRKKEIWRETQVYYWNFLNCISWQELMLYGIEQVGWWMNHTSYMSGAVDFIVARKGGWARKDTLLRTAINRRYEINSAQVVTEWLDSGVSQEVALMKVADIKPDWGMQRILDENLGS